MKTKTRRPIFTLKTATGSGDVVLGKSCGKLAPRILCFDIETSPNLAYVWQCYEANVAPSQMVKHGDILCYAAKWLGDPIVFADSREGDKDDKRVCRTLWELFDQADIVVAHNGMAFDTKTVQTRWVFHGMAPPSPYKQVDTLKLAHAQFRFGINKLDYLGRYLGIGKKVEHEGFDLWLKCMAEDHKAWGRMIEYNIQDVYLLEAVYMKLRAWDKRHPNVALYYDDGETRCVCCGDKRLRLLTKSAFTSSSEFPSYRCKNCGKILRSRKKDRALRSNLTHAI